MGLIKKDIDEMREENLIICTNCRRRPINILSKFDISYKGMFEIAHCNSCGSCYKLEIVSSLDALIRSIEKQITRLEEKQPWGWKSKIRSLEFLKEDLLRRT